MNDVIASGATTNVGIYNDVPSGDYTVTVDSTQITASTNTIRIDDEFITNIGASLLSGGDMTGAGKIYCAGIYDENYTFYASMCP